MAAETPKHLEAGECPFDLSESRVVFEGRWLVAREVDFRHRANGESGVWQSAHRPTKATVAEVQGVDVIAILKRAGKRFFVLVKQYRIPVGTWCIEFPAGLIDTNETAETAALRELKEETGFQGCVIERSNGIQPLDPGLCDDSCQFVMAEIDGDAPENANPKQNLDSAESIEVVLVECDKLLEFVRAHERRFRVEAMLYSFAIGFAMSRQMPPSLNGLPKTG
ncbi:hypothetical protein QR680_017453 [Steinernema hermaphroditum]|uniref:Nudix hydrolase domain-containing protein n=1 Tax=Steinernema hermaphroditum TaxID=289476 RepID=A0AA39HEM2_9BILA|nr:hypothetical protein QR680_017453 [Steinernema hermaphroditum]